MVAEALNANNVDAQVVDTGEDARRLVLGLVPEGAEVCSGKSKTLESRLVPGLEQEHLRDAEAAIDRSRDGGGEDI